MNIAVIGAGSIGMIIAGALAKIGADITLVTRTPEQAATLQMKGLVLHTGKTSHTFKIHTQSSNEDGQPADIIILTVKQTDLQSSYTTIHRWVTDNTILYALQNGWGHGELLAEQFPNLPVKLAVTTEAARRLDDHHVRHTGSGYTWVGEWNPAHIQWKSPTIRQKDKEFIETMREAGFDIVTTENIKAKMWQKWIMNCVINPVTALLEVKNGELLYSAAAIQMMKQIYQECIEVATAESADIDQHKLWESIENVCSTAANNQSSMLQDILQGRRTEIDSINGAMLALGASHGLELPFNQSVVHLLHAKQEIRMDRDSKGGEEMIQWVAEALSNLFAFVVTLPFVGFLLLYVGFYLYFENRRSAIRWSMDITTFFLILSVSIMYYKIFSSSFGFWLIFLLFLVLLGLIGGLQNQIRGTIHLAKMLRGAWRLGFVFLAFGYVLLFVWGISKNY